MLRIAAGLIVIAFLFEFVRTNFFESNDYDTITVLVESVDQNCVLQRKWTSGLIHSDPMPCLLAQGRAAKERGTFGLDVAYVQVARFSYRSPVDQRMYTGLYRTKPSLSPAQIGRSLEMRVSRKSPTLYKPAAF